MFGVQGLHTLLAGACRGHVLRKPQQEAQVTSSEVGQHLPQAMGPLRLNLSVSPGGEGFLLTPPPNTSAFLTTPFAWWGLPLPSPGRLH